ncbi:hypothetical protein A3Q56_00600 [Intoshia linei]|uniref:Serine/threonine-protein kinase ATR n=1 Tax=Intoshia linei TaxID=1819745 RepID=A0A177BBK2_9BILA|nr:hypothetical protein A3Q56_00600 [Intoshia linei]
MDEANLNIAIEKTKDEMSKIINKPKMTPKLLSKPPFRFIHDIVTNINVITGIFKNVSFTEFELHSQNMKNREDKINFLKKLFLFIEETTNEKVVCRPSKLVAGLEPNQTNIMLQQICKCINIIQNAESIQRNEITKEPTQKDRMVRPTSAKGIRHRKNDRVSDSHQPEKVIKSTMESVPVTVNKLNIDVANESPKKDAQEKRKSKNEKLETNIISTSNEMLLSEQTNVSRNQSASKPYKMAKSPAKNESTWKKPQIISDIKDDENGMNDSEDEIDYNLKSGETNKIQNDPENHGKLVQEILETREELIKDESIQAQSLNSVSQKRYKQQIEKQMKIAKQQLQKTTRLTTNLAKSFEYIQEEADMMNAELDFWKKETIKNIKSSKDHKQSPENETLKYINGIKDLDTTIMDLENSIISKKRNILINDETIKSLILGMLYLEFAENLLKKYNLRSGNYITFLLRYIYDDLKQYKLFVNSTLTPINSNIKEEDVRVANKIEEFSDLLDWLNCKNISEIFWQVFLQMLRNILPESCINDYAYFESNVKYNCQYTVLNDFDQNLLIFNILFTMKRINVLNVYLSLTHLNIFFLDMLKVFETCSLVCKFEALKLTHQMVIYKKDNLLNRNKDMLSQMTMICIKNKLINDEMLIIVTEIYLNLNDKNFACFLKFLINHLKEIYKDFSKSYVWDLLLVLFDEKYIHLLKNVDDFMEQSLICILEYIEVSHQFLLIDLKIYTIMTSILNNFQPVMFKMKCFEFLNNFFQAETCIDNYYKFLKNDSKNIFNILKILKQTCQDDSDQLDTFNEKILNFINSEFGLNLDKILFIFLNLYKIDKKYVIEYKIYQKFLNLLIQPWNSWKRDISGNSLQESKYILNQETNKKFYFYLIDVFLISSESPQLKFRIMKKIFLESNEISLKIIEKLAFLVPDDDYLVNFLNVLFFEKNVNFNEPFFSLVSKFNIKVINVNECKYLLFFIKNFSFRQFDKNVDLIISIIDSLLQIYYEKFKTETFCIISILKGIVDCPNLNNTQLDKIKIILKNIVDTRLSSFDSSIFSKFSKICYQFFKHYTLKNEFQNAMNEILNDKLLSDIEESNIQQVENVLIIIKHITFVSKDEFITLSCLMIIFTTITSSETILICSLALDVFQDIVKSLNQSLKNIFYLYQENICEILAYEIIKHVNLLIDDKFNQHLKNYLIPPESKKDLLILLESININEQDLCTKKIYLIIDKINCSISNAANTFNFDLNVFKNKIMKHYIAPFFISFDKEIDIFYIDLILKQIFNFTFTTQVIRAIGKIFAYILCFSNVNCHLELIDKICKISKLEISYLVKCYFQTICNNLILFLSLKYDSVIIGFNTLYILLKTDEISKFNFQSLIKNEIIGIFFHIENAIIESDQLEHSHLLKSNYKSFYMFLVLLDSNQLKSVRMHVINIIKNAVHSKCLNFDKFSNVSEITQDCVLLLLKNLDDITVGPLLPQLLSFTFTYNDSECNKIIKYILTECKMKENIFSRYMYLLEISNTFFHSQIYKIWSKFCLKNDNDENYNENQILKCRLIMISDYLSIPFDNIIILVLNQLFKIITNSYVKFYTILNSSDTKFPKFIVPFGSLSLYKNYINNKIFISKFIVQLVAGLCQNNCDKIKNLYARCLGAIGAIGKKFLINNDQNLIICKNEEKNKTHQNMITDEKNVFGLAQHSCTQRANPQEFLTQLGVKEPTFYELDHVKFKCNVIKRLIFSLQKTNNNATHDCIAFSIQEFIKLIINHDDLHTMFTCDDLDVILPLTNSRYVLNEIFFSSFMSNLSTGSIANLTIFNNDKFDSKNFHNWISCFCILIIEQFQDEGVSDFFKPLCGAIKNDESFAKFITAYVVYYSIIFDNCIEFILNEIINILTFNINTSENLDNIKFSKQKMSHFGQLHKLYILKLLYKLETMFKWFYESYHYLHSTQKHKNAKWIDILKENRVKLSTFLDQVEFILMAHNYLNLGAYCHGLYYYELHFKGIKYSNFNISILLDQTDISLSFEGIVQKEQRSFSANDLNTFQEIYKCIDESDAIMGVIVYQGIMDTSQENSIVTLESKHLNSFGTVSYDHVISKHQLFSTLTQSKSKVYSGLLERKIKNDEKYKFLEINNKVSLIRNMINLGQYYTAKTVIDKLIDENPYYHKYVSEYRHEVAHQLSDWTCIDSFINQEQVWNKNHKLDWNEGISQIIHNLSNINFNKTNVLEIDDIIIKMFDNVISLFIANADIEFGAYNQIYPVLIKFHTLVDLNHIYNYLNFIKVPEKINFDKTSFDYFNQRLCLTEPIYCYREPIISCYRHILQNQLNLLYQKFFQSERFDIFGTQILKNVYESDNEPIKCIFKDKISNMFIETAKLARYDGNLERAFTLLVQLDVFDDNINVSLERALWMKDRGDVTEAESLLTCAASKYYGIYINTNMSSLNENPTQLHHKCVYSKILMEIGILKEESSSCASNDIVSQYEDALKLDPNSETCHFRLARYMDKLLSSPSLKNIPKMQIVDMKCTYLPRIIECYGSSLVYGCNYIYQSLPRLLSLWLDFGNEMQSYKSDINSYSHMSSCIKKLNSIIESLIKRLPTFLFYCSFPQLVSRICHKNESVVRCLKTLISSIIIVYPQQSLWQMIAVIKSTYPTRSQRCQDIINESRKNCSSDKLFYFIQDILKLAEQLILLCNFKTTGIKSSKPTFSLDKNIKLLRRLFDSPKLSRIIIPIQYFLNVRIPRTEIGGCFNNSNSVYGNFEPFPSDEIYIQNIQDTVKVYTQSLQRPKIVTFICSDGIDRVMLCKPKDDLRKDARLMEFNCIINTLLRMDSDARTKSLFIRTYSVIPLNENCGMIEWVVNTKAFRLILKGLYEREGIKMPKRSYLLKYEHVANSPLPIKLQLYKKDFVSKFPLIFDRWFIESFDNPTDWYRARNNYSRTVAVMSIVGYILGLGDRHGENILFDSTTGDCVHVDFSCLFNAGEDLMVPEKVPFRLTRNMIYAMGPLGYEGVFRKACEVTLNVIKDQKDPLLSVLKSFLWDPLVEWNTGIKQKKFESGEVLNEKALLHVCNIELRMHGKLKHNSKVKFQTSLALATKGHVEYLIKEATNEHNLCLMYIGWGAYL